MMNRRSLFHHATASLIGTAGAQVYAGSNAQAANPPSDAAALPTRENSIPINVRAFGAVGDGLADDTAAIQAAIDHALRNNLQAVHIPPGDYRITDTIHLGHGDNYSTLALIGDATFAYAEMLSGAKLIPDRIDRPALNIQGARGTTIRNISILGRNKKFLDRKVEDRPRIADRDPSDWLAPELKGGLRRYAPYAAITIDAFSGPRHEDGYASPTSPAWLAASENASRQLFSSDIIVDRCWIGGFAAGIAIQPCDADGNGDFIKITNCQISNCVYGVAIGNSQSRNVAIRDCNYARVHTFITNKPFGRGIGTFGGSIDNVSGGVSHQFMDIFAARSLPMFISNLYFEAQSRIGTWSNNSSFNHTLVFQSCTFDFNEGLIGVALGPFLECGALGSVLFTGCSFSLPLRILNLVSGASHVGIESCMFGLISDYRGKGFYDNIPAPIARTLNYTCGGLFLPSDALKNACSLSGGNIGLGFDLETNAAKAVSYGPTLLADRDRRVVVHHFAREFVDRFSHLWTIRDRRQPSFIDKKTGAGHLLREVGRAAPDEISILADHKLEKTLAAPVEIGDIIHDPASGTIFAVAEIKRESDALHLRATQMNNLRIIETVITSTIDIGQDGQLVLYSASLRLGDTIFFGDFTAGSQVVTNIHRGDGSAAGLGHALLPGDTLHSSASGPPIPGTDHVQPYPPQTSVASVDEAGRTVTLNQKATVSARFMLSSVSLSG